MSLLVNTITASASKSYLQRALAISALTEGVTILTNVSLCSDSFVAKTIIENLGSETSELNRTLTIISNGIKLNTNCFSAGESGLSLRMFSPILALWNQEINFTGEGSLLSRPVRIIADSLHQLGVEVESNNGFLPITINGRMHAAEINIDGSLSSQLLTGLLIALPLLNDDSIINVSNLKSKPYVDMTLSIMQKFGVEVDNENYEIFRIKGKQKYKPVTYNIEGDWSGGAFFLVLGAVNGNIEVNNLDYKSAQADKEIISVLQKAGAEIIIKENSVIVDKNELNAFEFDATNCPDLFPPIVCLASQCKGTSVVKGISRLKHKESNRAEVLKQELAKVGIKVELVGEYMHIYGGKLKQGTINSHNDHRIAMLGGVLNQFCYAEIKIENRDSVNKSYPNFFMNLDVIYSSKE